MYTTPGPYFHGYLGTDMRPRQNVLDTEEDLFILEYAKTILYKRQIKLRMLSLLVEPFYPATEILTEATKQIIEEKTEKERNLEKTEKDQKTNKTTAPVKANNETNINPELKEYEDIKRNIIKIEINNKVGDTNYHQEL